MNRHLRCDWDLEFSSGGSAGAKPLSRFEVAGLSGLAAQSNGVGIRGRAIASGAAIRSLKASLASSHWPQKQHFECNL